MWVHEIDFQDVKTHEDTGTMDIYCNDHEEREHIRHMLLWNHKVLLFYSEKKRYWTRHGEQDEKDHYLEVKEYNRRMKEKAA